MSAQREIVCKSSDLIRDPRPSEPLPPTPKIQHLRMQEVPPDLELSESTELQLTDDFDFQFREFDGPEEEPTSLETLARLTARHFLEEEGDSTWPARERLRRQAQARDRVMSENCLGSAPENSVLGFMKTRKLSALITINH